MGARILLLGIAAALAIAGFSQSTVAAPTDQSDAQDWLYSCGGPPYPLSLFDEPTGAEQGSDGAARALRRLIAHPNGIETLPKNGWRRAPRLRRYQTFVARKPGAPRGLFEVVFKETAAGSWRYQFSSHYCEIGPQLRGQAVDSWRLDPAFPPPGTEDTRIHMLVQGVYCRSGKPPKLDRPLISSGPTRLIVSPVENPPRGDQSCLGSPPVRYTLKLGEPIGERIVLDAYSFPFKKRLDLRR